VKINSHFPLVSRTSPRQPYSLVAVVRDEEAVGWHGTPHRVGIGNSRSAPNHDGARGFSRCASCASRASRANLSTLPIGPLGRGEQPTLKGVSRKTQRAASPSVQRGAAQFREAVARRFRLLSKAAAEYDAGDDDQVVVLAAILRVLLTDRLIDHVAPLDQLHFSDTAYRLPASSVGGLGYGITRNLAYTGSQTGGDGILYDRRGGELARICPRSLADRPTPLQ
jgi:hypothetical protein